MQPEIHSDEWLASIRIPQVTVSPDDPPVTDEEFAELLSDEPLDGEDLYSYLHACEKDD